MEQREELKKLEIEQKEQRKRESKRLQKEKDMVLQKERIQLKQKMKEKLKKKELYKKNRNGPLKMQQSPKYPHQLMFKYNYTVPYILQVDQYEDV